MIVITFGPEIAVVIVLILFGLFGWVGAVDMRDVLSWFAGIMLPGQRFYGVGLLKRNLNWPTHGTWSGQLGFLVIGAPHQYKCDGEWCRKGRVVLFRSVPRTTPTKLKPDFSFG